jgi:hypothetical protein
VERLRIDVGGAMITGSVLDVRKLRLIVFL